MSKTTKTTKGTQGKESWDELVRAAALKPDESRPIKALIYMNTDGTLSLCVTDGIDNVYDTEEDWRWDIFLNKDGTWKID
jgi:hypothetical protein